MHGLLKHFIHLTEFLGNVLGPDYEIALYDVSEPDNAVIALANGHISGRTLGAPLTEMAVQMLRDRVWEREDFRINYTGLSMGNGAMLRSSTYYIKDPSGVPVGLLSINFDDSRYRELSDRLLKLIHPDAFVDTNFVYNKDRARPDGVQAVPAESFQESVSTVTMDAISQVEQRTGVPLARMTQEEKLAIIAILNDKGVFLIKNAVKVVAEQMSCSQASVYRYISKLGT